jgi:hypothetical protein
MGKGAIRQSDRMGADVGIGIVGQERQSRGVYL